MEMIHWFGERRKKNRIRFDQTIWSFFDDQCPIYDAYVFGTPIKSHTHTQMYTQAFRRTSIIDEAATNVSLRFQHKQLKIRCWWISNHLKCIAKSSKSLVVMINQCSLQNVRFVKIKKKPWPTIIHGGFGFIILFAAHIKWNNL